MKASLFRRPTLCDRAWISHFVRVGSAAAMFMLGGCETELPVSKTTVEADLVSKLSSVEAGKSDRVSMRKFLGAPWITSQYWQFDLFRVSGREVSAPVMFVLWWPVPMGVAVDQVTAYAVVTYDAAGLVVEHQHAFAYDPSVFHTDDRTEARARLVAGDLRFAADQDEAEAFLSVSARQRDEYLRTHSPGDGCTILIGCESSGCPIRIDIDERERASMPNLDSAFHDALQLEQVGSGTHRIGIFPATAHLAFQATSEFECLAGEMLYGLIRLEFGQPAKWFSAKWNASVAVSPEMPEAFRNRRLLIWGNGRWLVPGEPGQ